MATVGTIEAKVTADTSDFNSKMTGVNAQLQQTTGSLGNLITGVALGTAAWALFQRGVAMVENQIKASIDAFAQDETAVARLQTASQKGGIQWKDMAKVMDTEVANALKNTTFSMDEVVNVMAKMTTMGITGAKAHETLAAAEDAAAARGMDLNEVITNVIRGAAGYTRGLIMLGLNVESVKKATDKEAEITRQLTDLYGGAAQAQANTYAGQVKRLKNNFDEMRTTVAAQVIPILNDVVKQMFGFTNEVNTNVDAQTKLQEAVYKVVSGFKVFYDAIHVAWEVIKDFGLAIGEIPVILGSAVKDFIDNFHKIDDTAKVGFHNLTEHMKFWESDSKKTFEEYPTFVWDATKKTMDGLNEMWKEQEDATSTALGDLMYNWDAATKGIGFQFRSTADSMMKVATDTAELVGDQLGGGLDKVIKKEYDFEKAIKDVSDKHKEAIEKMTSDMADLTTAYEKANEDSQSSEEDSIASIIKTHEDKVDTLKSQLADETAFGKDIDEVKIAQTQDELAKEQAFLASHADDVAATASLVAEDEITKEKNKYAKEAATRKDEYTKKLADLKTQLSKENDAYNASLTDLGVSYKDEWDNIRDYIARVSSPEIVAAVQNMVSLSNTELAKLGEPLLKTIAPTVVTPTTKTVAASPTVLSAIQVNINDITAKVNALLAQAKASGLIPKAQEGGIISRTGLVLAHAGEMITPKGMSPSFNVNFYGNMSFGSQAEEDSFVDKIRKVLMRDFETAKLGIY